MLSLATLDEVQRHNCDDAADEDSPCAKRTLCSRKRRDEDVLEHGEQLIAGPLEPTSRTRSSFQRTFACPTPVYQTPPERAQKQNKTTISIQLTIGKVSRLIPSNKFCGNRPFRSSQSDCIRIGLRACTLDTLVPSLVCSFSHTGTRVCTRV